MTEIAIERLVGTAVAPHLQSLAKLRIEVFRDYPYLYDGSVGYEERYLSTYASAEGAVIIGAFAGEDLVGAATGLPMAGEPENITIPLGAAGFNIRTLFYFGESVLLAPYRGRGVGVAFFRERESHARSLGFARTVFAAVIRAPDDPRRPVGYKPLDSFWRRRGYEKLEGVTCTMSWRELGDEEETANRLQFWSRQLA